MPDRRTSKVTERNWLARQIGQMAEDAAKEYQGCDAKLTLVKDYPWLVSRMHDLWNLLAAEQAMHMPLPERPPFATITVGNFASVPTLEHALQSRGYYIGNWAGNLMGCEKFTLLSELGTLDLYRASSAELGYPCGCKVKQNFEALEKIGAKKLPIESGAQLRLQYPGQQPLGEQCLMYMDPIACPDHCSSGVFSVEHGDDGLCLYGFCGDPEAFCEGDKIWVYTRT